MSAETCGGLSDPGGRCDPKHPVHCCHFATTAHVDVPGRPNWVLMGYVCRKGCGKVSVLVMRRRPDVDTRI
jgi:hypothetical protein